MKTKTPKKIDRRQVIVDAMAKKFADHNSVEQVIFRHRKKALRSVKILAVIIACTIASIVVTGLFSLKVIDTPKFLVREQAATIQIRNPIDLLKADLASGTINGDVFALYCRDFLIRYDSLPNKYQTQISTATSDEYFQAILEVWPTLSLRTRQCLMEEMPQIVPMLQKHQSKWKPEYKDGRTN